MERQDHSTIDNGQSHVSPNHHCFPFSFPAPRAPLCYNITATNQQTLHPQPLKSHPRCPRHRRPRPRSPAPGSRPPPRCAAGRRSRTPPIYCGVVYLVCLVWGSFGLMCIDMCMDTYTHTNPKNPSHITRETDVYTYAYARGTRSSACRIWSTRRSARRARRAGRPPVFEVLRGSGVCILSFWAVSRVV